MNNYRPGNKPPSRFESILGKLLILVGFISVIIFLHWLLNPEFVGYKPLYYLLLLTFFYKAFRMIAEWLVCFHLSVPEKPKISHPWTVDILTTYCPPEPKEMVLKTLEHIQKITYPHNTFLCDESDDEELKRRCQELGIIHVTRRDKKDAKAGNINNALNTVANGEICVILDPDHIPNPNFLDEVLPYFEDDKMGYVQVAQVYYNQWQTVIAKAAAQQTYQFYGPFMMGLNSYGSVPAIGANCTFRRKALDSIGGHAPGLTEDMHTAMLLHAKKWKSVYNPVVVARGLVPSSYSAYCIQQLKWARGTFDLFFNVLPKVRNNLTWKQFIYYLSAPLFYIFGLFSLLDFLIPVIVLFSGLIPIKITLTDFFFYYFPLLIVSIAIRQFNQKWLLENHEKGAFILGGTLLKSSWWTSVIGLVYTIINKNVPYIPTPKDDLRENPIKLLIPNFVIILVSFIAIVYGLSRDFNPFMIFMAFLAAVNIFVLSLGALMALQKFVVKTHSVLGKTFITKGSKTRKWVYAKKQKLYKSMQLAGIPLVILTILAIWGISRYETRKLDELAANRVIPTDVFVPDLHGVTIGDIHSDAQFVYDTFHLDSQFYSQAVAFYDTCLHYGKLPYFILELKEEQLMDSTKRYDDIFTELFIYFREKYIPVLFAVIAQKTQHDTINEKLAIYLNNLIVLANQASFPNIAWVWHTNTPQDDPNIAYNSYSISWLQTDLNILESIQETFDPEKPILVVDGKSMFTKNPSRGRKREIALDAFLTIPSASTDTLWQSRLDSGFYVKGVAYNSGHDWRDNRNNIPLTRRKVEEDLQSIVDMGANTIRRYNPSVYDRNVLKEANNKGLKVLYGFWFDPKVDYATQQWRVKRYERQVLRNVRKYKDDESIFAWSLGNETWGLLKLYYAEPYLSLVRHEYVKMIASLAEKIKEIDPYRPILSVEEHTSHLSSAVYAFSNYAPHIDIFGINSYYIQNISLLDSVMASANPDMPYLVAEFGPKGYWHKEFNDYIYDTILYEHSSFAKAEMLAHQWEDYIYANKERNIGGVAFCWQDRYEATATWFGITDIFGNRKPSWYAMRKVFNQDIEMADLSIPEFRILMPRDYLPPGSQTRVVAATRHTELRNSYMYKWMLYEEGSFRKILETPFEKGRFEIRFKAPEKKSSYRMYLYVADEQGNVVTESKPLFIQWN